MIRIFYHPSLKKAADTAAFSIYFSILKICANSGTIRHMKTLYDVQQFLKSFGIVIYMGKRLYDIELMKIELERIYDAGLMDKLEYLEAEAVLRREHQLELKYIEKKGEWKK